MLSSGKTLYTILKLHYLLATATINNLLPVPTSAREVFYFPGGFHPYDSLIDSMQITDIDANGMVVLIVYGDFSFQRSRKELGGLNGEAVLESSAGKMMCIDDFVDGSVYRNALNTLGRVFPELVRMHNLYNPSASQPSHNNPLAARLLHISNVIDAYIGAYSLFNTKPERGAVFPEIITRLFIGEDGTVKHNDIMLLENIQLWPGIAPLFSSAHMITLEDFLSSVHRQRRKATFYVACSGNKFLDKGIMIGGSGNDGTAYSAHMYHDGSTDLLVNQRHSNCFLSPEDTALQNAYIALRKSMPSLERIGISAGNYKKFCLKFSTNRLIIDFYISDSGSSKPVTSISVCHNALPKHNGWVVALNYEELYNTFSKILK